jgi:hypothetical protein
VIKRSRDFDLGRDTDRMKARDAARQTATVDAILERFFRDDSDRRFEVQILADEVGMGKTFVALGVAYSILRAMQDMEGRSDLDGCYQRVLIVTPHGGALHTKWIRETGEFVKRCVAQNREEAGRWFAPVDVLRMDELSAELRKPGARRRILVTTMDLFGGTKLVDYSLKRRFLLGVLFRHWGTRFQIDKRAALLRGAPADWPTRSENLTALTDDEQQHLHFTEEEVLRALQELERSDQKISDTLGSVEDLLTRCREIAEPYTRDRDVLFRKVEAKLTALYRAVAGTLILQGFPLVVVDEAHNWKNGPSQGANGFHEFARFVACRARRILLLTATPFQLRPNEMLEILKVADYLAPTPRQGDSKVRRDRLCDHRERRVGPALTRSEKCSRQFLRSWSKLNSGQKPDDLIRFWADETVSRARSKLLAQAFRGDWPATGVTIEDSLVQVDPNLRPFARAALHLYGSNAVLSKELGALVVRHRRDAEHRLFKVGHEFIGQSSEVALRPDRHLLHGAQGMDVRGDGEIPHYLLMRCVTEAKKAKGRAGRSSLGSALTGCYSTLLESAEGRQVRELLGSVGPGKVYLDLLMSVVSRDRDPDHPKLYRVVDSVVDNWRRGEKTLIFCFRVNTAHRLRDIIHARIQSELQERATRCLGGERQFELFRRRLTSREQDLIAIGLDRVLWSLLWRAAAEERRLPFAPDALRLTDADLEDLARLSLTYEVPLAGDRVDRVFLLRATEYVVARRLVKRSTIPDEVRGVLALMAEPRWVTHPYGLDPGRLEEGGGEDSAEFDEKGVHTTYSEKSPPDEKRVRTLAQDLQETRRRANSRGQTAILDGYLSSPSLWLGEDPLLVFNESRAGIREEERAANIHKRLWSLSQKDEGGLDLESRRKVFQAIRRAILRRSVLLRLLPERSDRGEAFWGALLVHTFLKPLPGQEESMADRIHVFLKDLDAAGGSLSASEDGGMRKALFDATRLADQQFVALVSGTGGGKNLQTRERVFVGFNTPLLPEVLVCTSVGQEGIDLHRHCRHVIHYDLAWNPAVLEQRTGRADRIGSKTFRERERRNGDTSTFLEIGVPFLAGTYDERMYEELRIRAQTFEVLTGGEFAADSREGNDSDRESEGRDSGKTLFALPEELVDDLRVKLHVWEEKKESNMVSST